MTALRLAALLFVAAFASTVSAQNSGREVTLRRSVEPSFHIEPVVHRFKARRGEVIPFTFKIGSLGREMEVELTPVNLRQEENGVILHDTKNPLGEEFRVNTPLRFKLEPGGTHEISGRLTVPIARSNYLSYGLLVREVGSNPGFEETDKPAVSAGIRFVTQYVLRVDVETGVAGAGSMKDLQLESTKLIAKDGLPRIQTHLNNPTGFAFECFVNAAMEAGDDHRPAAPTRLGMLSRTGLHGDEKYLVRIMPRSRLRLEAAMTDAPRLGEQMLKVSVLSGRRQITAASQPVQVRGEDFPALASRRALIGPVSVSPAQLELGSIRQANRTAALNFRNTSERPMEVTLVPRDLRGLGIESVRYSPASFTLRPGRSKRVRATLRSAAAAGPASAVTHVMVAGDENNTHEKQLPLSIATEPFTKPSLNVSDVAWRPFGDNGSFAVTISNQTDQYVPLSGKLVIRSKEGGTLHMQDGYGSWLAPNASKELVFRPERSLPAGEYTLALAIATREDFEPITRRLNVVLASGEKTANAAPAIRPGRSG